MMGPGQTALEGIKVIDLTRVLGGPFATQVLGDFGAEVIKIEPPQGDETRAWGPPFEDGLSSYFVGANRNKRCMSLDLTRSEGREVLLRLLEKADVLIENFKPGTLETWGLDFERTLKPRFPRLIHCRITGFGSQGALGGLPGYDAAVQAWAGLMSVNGSVESGPLRMGVPIVDLAAGLYAVIGILLALGERAKSGIGQSIETSLFETGLALMHPHTANWFMSGRTGGLTGSAHTNISPYDLFPTKTTPIFLAIGNNRQFGRLCERLKRADLTTDPRFLENKDRLANREALRDELIEALKELEGRSLAEELLHAGIPAGPVLNVGEVLTHPQTEALGMVTRLGRFKFVSSPVKLLRTPARIAKVPEKFAQSTEAILSTNGFSVTEIKSLINLGVCPGLPRS